MLPPRQLNVQELLQREESGHILFFSLTILRSIILSHLPGIYHTTGENTRMNKKLRTTCIILLIIAALAVLGCFLFSDADHWITISREGSVSDTLPGHHPEIKTITQDDLLRHPALAQAVASPKNRTVITVTENPFVILKKNGLIVNKTEAAVLEREFGSYYTRWFVWNDTYYSVMGLRH